MPLYVLMENEGLSKVLFRVPEDDGTANVETLWAEALGDDRFVLKNSPFYAYGVSVEDVIEAPFSDQEGFHTFERVLEKGGNRTIRIIFDPPIQEGNSSDTILQDLLSRGCTYEGANPAYVCITVPTPVDFDSIRALLIERDLKFEHADPTYEDLFGK